MTLHGLDVSILLPAFIAGMLVLSTHVPLGQEVLTRGIVFIDLAIAQIAGVGVIVADSVGWEPRGWRVQIAACTAALLGSVLLTWTEKRWPQLQEALIGVLFVCAASLELLLLADNPHGGEHLKDLLVGQILWVEASSLMPVAVLYALVLAIWLSLRPRLGHLGFYALFAMVVTQSVQLVGIYLVFTSLIVPAIGARAYAERWRLPVGYAIGVLGYLSGLTLSALFDMPTGAVIVCTLVLTMIAAAVLAVLGRQRSSIVVITTGTKA